MSRLTNKTGDRYVIEGNKDSNDYVLIERSCIFNCIQKLGQYEDIDEKLGIDWVTFFKVITDGCYYRSFNEIFHFKPDVNHFVSLNIENKSVDLMYVDEYSMYTQANLMLNGYGTKWALTMEELV